MHTFVKALIALIIVVLLLLAAAWVFGWLPESMCGSCAPRFGQPRDTRE